MGHSGSWVLFLVSGMALASLSFGGSGSSDGTILVSAIASSGDVVAMNQGGLKAVIDNRKLKVHLLLERSYGIIITRNNGGLGSVYMEDYPRFDPTPSSKASIKAGPIMRGTHAPRPTPPGHPRHGAP